MPVSDRLLESLPDAMIIMDDAGQVRSANRAVEDLFGFRPDELIGGSIACLMPDRYRGEHQGYVDSFLLGGPRRLIGRGPREVPACRRDGSEFTVEISVSELPDPEGHRFVAVFRDVTARRRALEEMRISQEFFERLFDAAPLGIAVCDPAGRYVMVNPALCDMVQYSEEELLTMTYMDITHSEDTAANVAGRQPLLAGNERSFRMEKRYLRKDGQVVWALIVVSPITAADGRTLYTIGQMLNIDQVKRAELELVESRRQLRALSAHQEQLLEAERKHIAREVHDEMGQLLTALRMDVSLLRLRFGGVAGLGEAAGAMRALVDRGIDVVRQVTTNLRPAALELGVVAALEWLAEDFERRWGIPCRVRVEPEDLSLGDGITMAVFRVAQESLTNVARHAAAGQVKIRLARRGKRLDLAIEDDGRGFDEAAVRSGSGFGLMGMRERILALGGWLAVASAPGAGTRLVIEIPLDHVDDDSHPDR